MDNVRIHYVSDLFEGAEVVYATDFNRLSAELERLKSATQPQGEPVAALEKARDVLRAIIRDKAAGVHYASAQAACHQINQALEQPAPVAINKPTTINYSSLDAEDRLAVCRGECTKDEAAKNLLIKNLLRKVRATLHFTPEDVLAIDAVLRDDGK